MLLGCHASVGMHAPGGRVHCGQVCGKGPSRRAGQVRGRRRGELAERTGIARWADDLARTSGESARGVSDQGHRVPRKSKSASRPRRRFRAWEWTAAPPGADSRAAGCRQATGRTATGSAGAPEAPTRALPGRRESERAQQPAQGLGHRGNRSTRDRLSFDGRSAGGFPPRQRSGDSRERGDSSAAARRIARSRLRASRIVERRHGQLALDGGQCLLSPSRHPFMHLW
jgi:hypothetical protein